MKTRKKREKQKLETMINETVFKVVLSALQQILDTEVYNEETEKPDQEMTIKAMRQKAQMSLNFVKSIIGEDEYPRQGKEQRIYAR